MGCFAVIDVDQDCDYVSGATCIGAFSSEAEAYAFVEDKQNIILDSHKARREYIDNYVDENVRLPEINFQKCQDYQKSISPFVASTLDRTDYQKWSNFKRAFLPFDSGSYTTPDNFLKELKFYLYNNKAPEIFKDFNPPVPIFGFNNMFVVEIPELEAGV